MQTDGGQLYGGGNNKNNNNTGRTTNCSTTLQVQGSREERAGDALNPLHLTTMASTFPDPAILGGPEGDQGPLKFTLQIMSPSSNVPQPLIIQSLPATATVKELKHRLRNILEASPSDQSQRLIHRGRLLAREEETMLNVFGEETVCSRMR